MTFDQQFRAAFGEIPDNIRTYDIWGHFLSYFTIISVTLVMMNLLIGILSESVGRVYDNKARMGIFQLTRSLIDAESLMFYKQCGGEHKPRYLVFAKYIEKDDDIELERGRLTLTREKAEENSKDLKEHSKDLKENSKDLKEMKAMIVNLAKI